MPNIIVVDDDPTNTTLLKMLLELDGNSVNSCSDIPSAMEAADNDTDVFVVDYHLARGTKGLELLTAVRNGETAASQDTIFIITSGDYRCEPEVMEAGANQFLLKPYQPNVLSEKINQLLGGT